MKSLQTAVLVAKQAVPAVYRPVPQAVHAPPVYRPQRSAQRTTAPAAHAPPAPFTPSEPARIQPCPSPFRPATPSASRPSRVVQRIGDLDDPQYETATEIKFLGGNPEGVFLVSDGKKSIVVKPAAEADCTVLAYNLAKDFQVRILSARQATLESPQGAALFEKAAALEATDRLARGFEIACRVIPIRVSSLP